MAGGALAGGALAGGVRNQYQHVTDVFPTLAEAVRLTAYQAAWHLSAGLPADREITIAKYWASEGGFRVVHAAVHVHGRVGVGRDYPLHRHFQAARRIELTLGHAEDPQADLGRLIAAPQP